MGNAQTSTQTSSTFLTFPLKPQWLLSDGREYTSVFHASLCGSIRICGGNPHPGRQVCSLMQLELIYPSYERSPGVWMLFCRFVVASHLAVASPRNRWSHLCDIFPQLQIRPGVYRVVHARGKSQRMHWKIMLAVDLHEFLLKSMNANTSFDFIYTTALFSGCRS